MRDDYVSRKQLFEALYSEDAITFRGADIVQTFPAADVQPVKWISASKLPPKEDRVYADGTVFSVYVVGTEGFTYRKAYYNFKAKVWLDGNNEEEWPEITRWMLLPEPPKEET